MTIQIPRKKAAIRKRQTGRQQLPFSIIDAWLCCKTLPASYFAPESRYSETGFKSGDWKNLRFPARRIDGVPQGILTRGEAGARYRATDAVHILP